MIIKGSYFFMLLSISGGLLSLLGSLGIFVSLTIQRRVERLQEILEDLVNQSYLEDINLTSKIYHLINRYQMHYIVPDNPSRTITWYVNSTIIVVVSLWLTGCIIILVPPFSLLHILVIIPIPISIFILIFFRKLLKNAINPLDNSLLNSIIPPPVQLRSVSFLSSYVNISVKSLLKQARFTIFLEKEKNSNKYLVILKEELSFDDFFYYFTIYDNEKVYFIGFGNLIMEFPPDPITKKPIPVQRNINIPLGNLNNIENLEKLKASKLIFSKGEKHPIQYDFTLGKNDNYFIPIEDPCCFNNQNITYKFSKNFLNIIECKAKIPYLKKVSNNFYLKPERKFLNKMKPESINNFLVCNHKISVK